MRITNEIKSLIDKIINLNIAKGIQPAELSEAIFDNEYSSIDIKKQYGHILVIVSFIDSSDQNNISHHSMKYTYNEEKYLLQIEEKINNKNYKIVWNRNNVLECLYADLSSKLLALNPAQKVDHLLKQLPDPEIYQIFQNLKLVA